MEVLARWARTGSRNRLPLSISANTRRYSSWVSLSNLVRGLFPTTIYVNGVEAELATPFLNIGQRCATHSNFFTSLGSCVCYRGESIEYDWYSDDNMSCLSKRGYVWGFASFLTLVGLILEAVWAIGCCCVWLDANLNSNILKNRRSCVGVTRNALEMAESVNRDVGTSRSAYSGKELENALKRCDKITYSVEEKGDVSRIGNVSEGLKQRPWIYEGIRYS